MPAFALFGSSYISRLERFCNGDLQVPMSCHFFGAGGMKVTSISVPKYTQLLQLNPDYVFIQLGGNDISSTTTPREIFEKIIVPDVLTIFTLTVLNVYTLGRF